MWSGRAENCGQHTYGKYGRQSRTWLSSRMGAAKARAENGEGTRAQTFLHGHTYTPGMGQCHPTAGRAGAGLGNDCKQAGKD